MTERRIKARKDDYPKPWEAHPISRDRWRRHRDRMMEETRAGSRPDEWWEYERKMDPPRSLGEEHVALFEMGELSEEELAELMVHWRERYEKANEPGFSYCTGNGWLTGEEAQRRMYCWAGIPPAIVKQWDAARARRARAIKALATTERPESDTA